jgi:hypothetical protein
VRFSRLQRGLVVQAMDEAEKHTARYYCIPPHQWQDLRYDLLTCEDNEWEPLPESALARLRRLRGHNDRRGTCFDFYRIELNDPSILKMVTRENLQGELYPFFVYILTHEMVHLVRLSTILSSGDQTPPNEIEESRVRRISHQILTASGKAHLRSMWDKFSIPLNPA